jgi:hypothetical protein
VSGPIGSSASGAAPTCLRPTHRDVAGRFRIAARLAAAAVLVAFALGGGDSSAAFAIPPDDPDVPDTPCLRDLRVLSFAANRSTVPLRHAATVSWNVKVPNGCGQLGLDVNGEAVRRQGTLSVAPIANTTYALRARWRGRLVGTIASVTVRVALPPRVTISGNHLAPLLRQAVNTPDTTVRVRNNVRLDLSLYPTLPIARGVTLIGGRTASVAGPVLYTRNRPKRLFVIRGNDVRISGLRIQGADMDIASGDDRSSAIYVWPGADAEIAHVEVDHNEIYGWSNAAVGIYDAENRIRFDRNPWAVRIHDNFIHHNQHANSAGYGVVVGDGAYALIDRNVFDYNRHAIAGDGSDGSGYRLHRNLVLQHGGRHKWGPFWRHTHQFDMHGQDWCGAPSYCGTAGHFMDIRLNSVLYTEGAAINIRGTPQLGAWVASNVFAHEYPWDAVKQTPFHSGLHTSDNRYDVDGSDEYGVCDFDGDGTNDRFMATGETWWYASRRTRPWTYLNTSQLLLSQVTLGHFDSDSRCDVVSGGLISSGGTAPWRPR